MTENKENNDFFAWQKITDIADNIVEWNNTKWGIGIEDFRLLYYTHPNSDYTYLPFYWIVIGERGEPIDKILPREDDLLIIIGDKHYSLKQIGMEPNMIFVGTPPDKNESDTHPAYLFSLSKCENGQQPEK